MSCLVSIGQQIKWFKTAENTDAKYIGNFLGPIYYIRQIIAQISQKKQRKTHGKFRIYYKTNYCLN